MNPRLGVIVALIVIAAGARVALSVVPNVSPMAAVALFSGVFLADRRLALLIPLLAMLLGDLVLGLHATMLFVYGAFMLTVLMGFWVARHYRAPVVIGAALASSALFFVVTNFGVWLLFGMYPMTVAGLIECYVMALPFLQQTMIGDLFFTAMLFGLFIGLQRLLPELKNTGKQLTV